MELAKTGGAAGKVMIRPVVVDGQKVYVMYLHSTQVTSLRTNTAAGQWLDIQKAAMAGLQSSKSPIFSGALGMYNGVVLREAQDVTQGVSDNGNAAVANTRRAVLLGAQAATVAYGKAGGDERYRWNEELYDTSGTSRSPLGDLGPEEDDVQRRRLRRHHRPDLRRARRLSPRRSSLMADPGGASRSGPFSSFPPFPDPSEQEVLVATNVPPCPRRCASIAGRSRSTSA